MKKSSIILIAIIAVVAILCFSCVGKYNTMVSKEESVTKELKNIDTYLQRRADLIPNLVSTVKGYASHEEKIISNITSARTNLLNAKTTEDKANANEELSNAIKALMVVVENYPDLKANQNFINLQDELAGTENRIAVARKNYNDTVSDYNFYIKKFPTNIIAGMFKFESKDYFEANDNAKTVPEVNFD